MVLTAYFRASSRIEGNFSPGLNFPERISRSRRAVTKVVFDGETGMTDSGIFVFALLHLL